MDSAIDLNPLNVPELLRAHNLSPKKSLGQNFLLDPHALRRIVECAELPENALVLEIGPGLGSLTRYLARSAKRVVAVELDQHLIPVLKDVVAPFENVRVVHGDMLELDPAALMGGEAYSAIANIPYYITSALIRHLLEADVQPERLVFTMQKEVADRICAEEGKMSLLALSVQVYGRASKAVKIPAGAFYPPPKVDSATLRVDLYPEPLIPAEWIDSFFRLAKAGFSQKRKNLRNSLSGGLAISKEAAEALLSRAEIDPMRRAETLSLPEWRRLTEMFTNLSNQ
ncbi:MAG: ribosomal RNA small subunit methyltransferase A [Anaerolineaceae bacterium]|nr:ribosomal RNA small subunit methyltransferase A [Anaerolineaceae bacterium]